MTKQNPRQPPPLTLRPQQTPTLHAAVTAALSLFFCSSPHAQELGFGGYREPEPPRVEEQIEQRVEEQVQDQVIELTGELGFGGAWNKIQTQIEATIEEEVVESIEESVVDGFEERIEERTADQVDEKVAENVEETIQESIAESMEDTISENVEEEIEESVAAVVEDTIQLNVESSVEDEVVQQVEIAVAITVEDRLEGEIDDIIDRIESEFEIREERIHQGQWLVMAEPSVFEELEEEGYLFDTITELPGMGMWLADVAAPSSFDISVARQGVVDVVGSDRAEVDLNHIYTAGTTIASAGAGIAPRTALDLPDDTKELSLRVGMIDSAVDVEHPALSHSKVKSRSFVADTAQTPNFHGTAIASIIAA